MKTRLMKKRLKGEWRLVISIHGAEDVIATNDGFLRNRSLFCNRTQNARFLGKKCTEHIGAMRSQQPTAPPAP